MYLFKAGNNKKYILLAEHEASASQRLAMLLETRGYRVKTVASAQEVLEKVSSSVDLILLDSLLPDQDGFQFCHKLKLNPKTSHIPIILLSNRILTKDVIEGLYMGADDYLTKPFEYEELVARMEAVLRRSSILHHQEGAFKNEEVIIQELRRIMQEELIVPYFQPMYLFNPTKLFGFEILSRPQTKSILSDPEVLFKVALKFGLYHELELLCWKKALEKVASKIREEKLFLNCNPYFIQDVKVLELKKLFERYGVDLNKVFLEITERSAISDFQFFFDHLKLFREYGFKFAVDDVGGGYASLESIVETRPEVVKIDQHIISHLENDEFKKSIVRFIVSFCKENHILCVAEGIETEPMLNIVRELGIDAGQGYYLYKPSPEIDIQQLRKKDLKI